MEVLPPRSLMSSSSEDLDASVDLWSWTLVGSASELSKQRCRLLRSSRGHDWDLALFCVERRFFAMDARCSHAGGPLCDGDIEEADGVLKVFCPWHDYAFDLRTGESGTKLKQRVYQVKLEDGNVFVKHPSLVSP